MLQQWRRPSLRKAQANHYFARYLGADGGARIDWLVVELLGVTLGGFLSALLAGRVRGIIERGPRISGRSRLVLAFGGGGIMGTGAVLARGCTSGQALTGGALLECRQLAVHSWRIRRGVCNSAARYGERGHDCAVL